MKFNILLLCILISATTSASDISLDCGLTTMPASDYCNINFINDKRKGDVELILAAHSTKGHYPVKYATLAAGESYIIAFHTDFHIVRAIFTDKLTNRQAERVIDTSNPPAQLRFNRTNGGLEITS